MLSIWAVAWLVFASARLSQAASFVWDGGHAAQDKWSLQHNWNPNGAPPNPGTADLIFTGSIRLTPDADGGAWSINSITFNASAGAFNLIGDALTLGSNATALANNSANLQTLDNALLLAANQTWNAGTGGYVFNGTITLGTRTLTLTGTGDTTATGIISGTGALIKTGTGTVTLSGANTYAGGTTVSTGALRGTTTSLQGNIVNNAGVIFDQATDGTYAAVISGTGTLTKTGAGIATLSGVNTFTGTTMVAAGTLALGAANALADTTAVSVATGATLQLAGSAETVGSIAGAGSINLGSHALTTGGTDASTTFSGVIHGTGSLIKTGTGVFTLAGNNTYSGGTTVSSGTLLGSSASLQGNITNSAAVVFDQATDGSFAGVVSGAGTLTKQSAGTLTLTGVNTYTGATNLNGGTLALGTANALASTTNVSVAAGATLQLAASHQTVGSIAGAGGIDVGSFTLSAGASNTSTTFSGVVSGSGALTKVGSGTLTLAGSNTYSGGTTVSAGTLQGTTTSLQGNIVNNAGLVFDQAANGAYTGVISGNGTLTKQGSGTLTLTGANLYSGPTTVSGGTLSLGASNAFSSASGLTLNTASNVNLAGFSVQVGTLAYHTAIIDFGTAATSNYFLFTGGGTSTGTLTVNNYNTAQGDVFAFQTGAPGVSGGFVSGIYFYGIGGGVLGPTGQTLGGYSGLWNFIVPDTSPFKTWDGGGGDNNWSTGANWSGDTAPVSSFTLKLAFDGSTRTAPVMNSNYNINTLRFEASAGAFSLTSSGGGGGSELTFGGSVPSIIQLSANNQNVNVPLVLNSTTIVETSGAGALTLAGEISGSGGLTKLAAGTLVLSGANSYSGATTVDAGTVTLRHSSALGTTAAGTTVSSGATLQLENNISVGTEALALNGTLRNVSGVNTYGGAISGAGSILVSAGNLTLSGAAANTYTGNTTVHTGQLDLAKTAGITAVAGNIVVGDGTGAATLRLVNSNQISDTARITLADTGTPVFNVNGKLETIGSITSNNTAAALQLGSGTLATGGDNTSTTFAGVISGTGALTKQGSGTFTLTGPNTYTGATTISAGTVVARHSTALGTVAGGVSVASGATLQLENSVTIGAEPLTLNGNLRSASGTNSYGGAISGTGALSVDTGALTLTGTTANTFTGTTTVHSGQLDLSKTAGINSVAGNLIIGTGAGTTTVRLVTANQIGDTSAVTLGASGTPVLNLNNQADTIGSLASTNTAAAVQLGSAILATGGDNSSTTFAGVISGTGGLTKQGTGTLTLTGANIYSGPTTVSAGTLTLGTSNAIATTTNLSLGSSATLALGGTSSVLVNVLNFNSSTIDFGTAGTTNHFLFNTAGTNTGTLTIANWTSGTDIFGVANGTVSQSFLDNLFFSNLNVGIGAVLSASPISVAGYGNFYTLAPIPTFIWDGGQSSGPVASQDDWNQSANWTGNIAPAVGAMKAIVMAGSARLATDMNGAYQVNSLLFRSDAGAFTISSSTSDTLTVGGGGINNQSTSTQTLAVPLALAANQTWTAGSGNLVFSGTSILNGANTLTIAGDFNTTISAVIDAGSGGLVKNGTGLLTLSGTNTFMGGVTLNAGVISVGSDTHLGAAGSGLTFAGGTLRTSAGLTSARTLTLNTGGGTFDTNGFNSTLAGAISGSGGFTKVGTGTLTLTGANTYSGGTTISGGILSGNTTSLQGSIINNAALTFDQAATGTFAGAISGNGTVTKQNTGTLTLTGANTYAGTTTISGGTLAGSTTSLPGNIVNHAALVFDQAVNGTTTGVISGTGSLTKQGAGTLTLGAASSYTGTTAINTGTLQLGVANALPSSTAVTVASGATLAVNGLTQTIGSLAGAGTLSVGSGTLLAGADNSNTTFGGSITGTGVFNKIGSGTLTFNSSFTFGGELKLTGGTLSLAGINLTVDTLRISGNTVLDFGSSVASILTTTHLIIENGAILTINNWVDLQDYFRATGSFYGYNTTTTVITPAALKLRGDAPQNQIVFTGFSANSSAWVSYDHQITPTPEPATYGAIFTAGALVLWQIRRSRRQTAPPPKSLSITN